MRRAWWRAAAPLVAGVLLALLPAPAGLAPHAWHFFAIFAAVILGLVLAPLPGGAIGLMGVTLLGLWVRPKEWGARFGNWWRPAIVVMAVMGLTVAPWLARDFSVHHRFVWISTNGGLNFWVGNNPFTTGSCFDVRIADLAAYSGDVVAAADGAPIVQVNPYPLPLELRDKVTSLDEVALDRALYEASFAFIRAHPRRWVGLLAQKFVSLWWFRPNIGRSSGFYQESWILPYQLLYTGALAAAVAGFILSLKHWRRHVVPYGMLAYLTVVYVAYHAITRYRWEMEPYLLVLAALTLVTGWRRVSSVLPRKAR